jgi:chromosome partitioning protein
MWIERQSETKMRTVAIVNQKGGCGKTTVSINLASALAELGKKVLLVDMDPQSHCAVGLAVPEEQIEQSIYDVLISKSRNEPIRLTEIMWQIGDNLELAPASIDLSAYEQQMAGIPDRECCLRDVLEDVKEGYDFAVIDCPPAVSLLTFNALRAATDVVVPVETGYFALHGLSKQLETLSILCKRCQQHVSVRVLASMYDIRTKMAREILAELRSHFADQMYKTVVNFNTRIKEASSFGQPINEYDPASKGQQDFRMLAQEVIGSEERPQVKSKRLVDSLADQLEAIGASANELLKVTKVAPMVEPKPAIEPKLVVAPTPMVEHKPAPEPKPVIDQRPVIDSKSVVEPKPVAEQRPVIEQRPAVEPKPVMEPKPVAEYKPVAEQKPIIEQRPVTPEIPVVEQKAGIGQKPIVALKKEPEPVAAAAVFATREQIAAPASAGATLQTLAESVVQSTGQIDAKLSEYYGVNQMQDAVVFVTLYPRAETVAIAGDFNNWQPATTPMQRVGETGVWQAKMKLPHGTYRYRLVVDGQWQQDPYNERSELNPYGDYNSILEVK